MLPLILFLISPLLLNAQTDTCNATIDNFGSEALGQGIQTQTGSFVGSFGEQIISAMKPSVHVRAKGGLTEDLETFGYGTGACTVGYYFSCTTGTTAYGYSVIRSSYAAIYHPGESIIGRWTQALVTPCYQGDCLIAGGLFTTTDGLLIGYKNNVFSVGYQHWGNVEMQTLTITTAATSASTVTVTVSGTAVVISLTVSNAATNAAQILAGLTAASLPRAYYFEQVNNQVLATGQSTDEVVQPFAFAAGTTGAVAAWVENAAATPKREEWVGRSSMEGASQISFLNETSLNVYQIIYGYLGIANIQYQVLNPSTGKFVTMHTVRPANKGVEPSLRLPSMKIGWITYRPTLGNANYQILGGSAQISRLELFDEFVLPTWGSNVEATGVTAAAERYLLSIRSQRSFNAQIAITLIRINLVTAVTDSTKGAIIRVVRNCVITGTPNWLYVAQASSVVTIDKAATGCTNGEQIGTFMLGANGNLAIDTSELAFYFTTGGTISFLTTLISGAASEVDLAITWSEDF